MQVNIKLLFKVKVNISLRTKLKYSFRPSSLTWPLTEVRKFHPTPGLTFRTTADIIDFGSQKKKTEFFRTKACNVAERTALKIVYVRLY